MKILFCACFATQKTPSRSSGPELSEPTSLPNKKKKESIKKARTEDILQRGGAHKKKKRLHPLVLLHEFGLLIKKKNPPPPRIVMGISGAGWGGEGQVGRLEINRK